MANTITSTVIHNGPRNFESHVVIENTGTASNETNTVLFDASSLGLPEDGSMKLAYIDAQLAGFTAELAWDGNTNATFLVIPDFDLHQKFVTRSGGVKNTAGTPTGDVLISTTGIGANERGSFTIGFKKS